MNFVLLEEKLTERIHKSIEGVTPGMMIQVHYKGKKVCDLSLGKTFAYYDLASLTKIIFTVQALMWAYENKKWTLSSFVIDFVPWFQAPGVRILELLNHSSGLPAWVPFYEKIQLDSSRSEKWIQLKDLILKLPLEKKDFSVYSDVGFLVLGFALEKMFDQPLIEIWKQVKDMFYPHTTFEFSPDNVPKQEVSLYAPTEECTWRHKMIRGEVHDDNAWSLGGVSTHAGLFGSIDDLGWYSLMIRSQLLGYSRSPVKLKTAQLFSQRSRPFGKGDWALGYMMTTMGTSSSGSYFSPYSIGHTGFTGTSIWYDPTQDLGIAILSNRVLYGRNNEAFKKLRPQIHNWIVEGLRRGQL